MSELVITAQPTPNPNAMKFTANRPLGDGPAESFYTPEAAKEHPIAGKLFEISGVTGVMILADFCSVNKDGNADWDVLRPQIEQVLRESYG